MRLIGQIHITVRGDVVLRDPSWWEKLKQGLGSRVDLETGEVRNGIEATAIVDAVRRALGRLGVTNALSLVIDDTVIFQDTDGKPDDLPDLVLALSEHASVFGRGFRELRFAAEHEEAGLRLVIEARARTRHRKEEPAAIVSVGGRLAALEPARGESAEAYRTRVEPLIQDPARFESARHAFESFVQRLEGALAAMLPDAEVREKKAETRLVRAQQTAVTGPERVDDRLSDRPLAPGYDPYVRYYPSPMGMMLDAMIFSSFMHMVMPPPVMVVSPLGAPLGSMSDVQAQPQLASAEHVAHSDASLSGADPGSGYDGASADDAGADGGGQADGDGGAWWDDAGSGGSNDGGGGWGDDGGGWDGGGGDFGGDD